MVALSVRMPESLRSALKELAKQEGISVNQFIVLSVAEKMSALKTEDYFKERAARASREKFDAAMAKVPDVPPIQGDELP